MTFLPLNALKSSFCLCLLRFLSRPSVLNYIITKQWPLAGEFGASGHCLIITSFPIFVLNLSNLFLRFFHYSMQFKKDFDFLLVFLKFLIQLFLFSLFLYICNYAIPTDSRYLLIFERSC